MTVKTATRSAKPAKKKRAPKRKPIGVVDATKAYNLDQFMKVMGCNWPAVRDMKRRGLKVRKDGGRVMIRGQDYLDYLGTLPPAVANHSQSSPAPEDTIEPARGDGSS